MKKHVSGKQSGILDDNNSERKNQDLGSSDTTRRTFLKGSMFAGGVPASLAWQNQFRQLTADRIEYIRYYRHANPREVGNGNPPNKEPVYDTMSTKAWKK